MLWKITEIRHLWLQSSVVTNVFLFVFAPALLFKLRFWNADQSSTSSINELAKNWQYIFAFKYTYSHKLAGILNYGPAICCPISEFDFEANVSKNKRNLYIDAQKCPYFSPVSNNYEIYMEVVIELKSKVHIWMDWSVLFL